MLGAFPAEALALELASGWPLGLALALLAFGRLVAERRRVALNRALHELRRPLQALALAPPRPTPARALGPLELALAAVEDLESEINRTPAPPRRRPLACRAALEQAVERWRPAAASRNRSLELRWRAGAARVRADPVRLAQAFDNLIVNALEHGGLRVRVEATRVAGRVRIVVRDSAGAAPRAARRRGDDPRRGHGLRVVARIAREHQGRFALARSPSGTVAALELPLAPP